ncbi:hypothetical protein ACEWY4_023836 [Coilia grayii]|uniref:Uncharacterized protein n=1 Tax=Coilia grayii TaxID=363190 RepID=A0ABD1J2A2_9TELE
MTLPLFSPPRSLATRLPRTSVADSIMDKDSFLKEASLLYKDSCPELARFLMRNQQMDSSAASTEALCPFCFQWREPDNHRVRLRPKHRPSAHLQRILGREAKGCRLSLAEKDTLSRFRRSSSCLVSRG